MKQKITRKMKHADRTKVIHGREDTDLPTDIGLTLNGGPRETSSEHQDPETLTVVHYGSGSEDLDVPLEKVFKDGEYGKDFPIDYEGSEENLTRDCGHCDHEFHKISNGNGFQKGLIDNEGPGPRLECHSDPDHVFKPCDSSGKSQALAGPNEDSATDDNGHENHDEDNNNYNEVDEEGYRSDISEESEDATYRQETSNSESVADLEEKPNSKASRTSSRSLDTISLAVERGGRRRGKHVNDDGDDGEGGEEDHEEGEEIPQEIVLNTDRNDPRGCKDGHIMLVEESFEPVPSGQIALGPVPFLGQFTAFGRQHPKVPVPPKVQSRWNLVRIRLRKGLAPRCPIDKYAHPLPTTPSKPSREYLRPPVPLDPKRKRRILHHYPVSGDKKHIFKLLIPSGYYRRRSGGGWSCRRWIRRKWPRKLINHTEKEWKAYLKAKEKKDKIEDAQFEKDLKEVYDGIAGLDQGIMKQTYLMMVKDAERRKERKQELYDQWDLHVFNYIQRQTQDKINDPSYDPDVVTARQMDRTRKYCKAWQRRRLFLDIIHPEEYDPYEYQDTAMKYSTKHLYDPIKHDWLKETREKIFMGEDVFIKPRSKETLELANWTEPAFKACMAGRVCCDDEVVGDRQHLAKVPEKWESHPVLYNKRWGPEFWHTSFPKGGKCCNMPRPEEQRNADPPSWRGIGIVWDAPQKLWPKLQISEEHPNF